MTNINNTLLKYLFDGDDNIIKNLKIDDISRYSVTPYKQAEEISELVEKYMGNKIIITDMTACTGGNTISFAKHFKKVNAIEICKERYEFLKHNLKIYNLLNVDVYFDDCMKMIDNIEQDVIMIDPPWLGRSYKYKESVDLFLSKEPIYKICNKLYGKSKLILLKVPKNFNQEKFNDNIIHKNFKIYQFVKLQIIVLQNIDKLSFDL